jgi:hypothetical protein
MQMLNMEKDLKRGIKSLQFRRKRLINLKQYISKIWSDILLSIKNCIWNTNFAALTAAYIMYILTFLSRKTLSYKETRCIETSILQAS